MRKREDLPNLSSDDDKIDASDIKKENNTSDKIEDIDISNDDIQEEDISEQEEIPEVQDEVAEIPEEKEEGDIDIPGEAPSENAYSELKSELEDSEDEVDSLDKKLKRQKRINVILVITIIILLLTIGSCSFLRLKNTDCTVNNGEATPTIDPSQGQYSTEELETVYEKLIDMPGWYGFTIPANTLTITTGFEFHNPETNSWYEDTVSINGQKVETFIVGDSEVEINHLLRLVGIKDAYKSVKSCDEDLFKIFDTNDNKTVIKGIKNFEGTKDVVIETVDGKEVTLNITCNNKVYYMTFGLYLKGENDNDELLYQSGLVEPGMYIQKMELSRSLKSGTYDAYVLLQPYYEDGVTKTNSGIVEIKLTAF